MTAPGVDRERRRGPISPCIDIHAHFLPPGLVDDLRAGPAIDGLRLERADGQEWMVFRQGPRVPLQPEVHDLEARLALMDRWGVDRAGVSLSPTLLMYWLEPSEAADWARTVNDALAELQRQSGGRLFGVAHLPMQDTDAAIAELERTVGDLGLRGAQVGPLVMDEPLDVADHVPVLEAADRLDVPLILHPYFVGAGPRPGLDRYYLTNLVGHPYSTALGASRLIMSGTLDRLPRLRTVLVHGGGYLPYQVGRLDRGHSVRPESKACQDRPSSYLRRFWFDTLTHSPEALSFLIRLVGSDRVAYGTDFPYDMGGGSANEHLEGVEVDADGAARIRGANGAALFRLH